MVQKRKTITVHNVDIVISTQKDSDYISLTDIAESIGITDLFCK